MRNKRFCSLVMAATVTLSGFLGAYGDSLLNINSEGARQFEVTAEAATYRSSDLYNTTGGAYMKIKDTMNVEFGKVKVDMKGTYAVLNYADINMVPYDLVFGEGGAGMQVSKSGKKITIKDGSNKLVMTVGSKNAKFNGKSIKLDYAPQQVKFKKADYSTVMVPAKNLANIFGLYYNYSSNNEIITLARKYDISVDGDVYNFNMTSADITVDGKKINQKNLPVLYINGTAYMRLYTVFKSALGCTVKENKEFGTITITKGNKSVVLSMDSSTAVVGKTNRILTASGETFGSIFNGLNPMNYSSGILLAGEADSSKASGNIGSSFIDQSLLNNQDKQKEKELYEESGYEEILDEFDYEDVAGDAKKVKNLTTGYSTVMVPGEYVAELLGIYCEYDEQKKMFYMSADVENEDEDEESIVQPATTSVVNNAVFPTTTSASSYANIAGTAYTGATSATTLPAGLSVVKVTDISGNVVDTIYVGATMQTTTTDMYGGSLVISPYDSNYRGEETTTMSTADYVGGYVTTTTENPNAAGYGISSTTMATTVATTVATTAATTENLSELGNATSTVGFGEDEKASSDSTENAANTSKYHDAAMYINLPEGVDYAQTSAADLYALREIMIKIPGNHMDFYGDEANLPTYKYKKVSDVEARYNESFDRTELIIYTDYIQGFSYTLAEKTGEEGAENDVARLEIGNPGDFYENIVVLDPGHGGSDPGTTYGKYKEKEINMNMATYLGSYLTENGTKVYMTRSGDVLIDLYKRAEFAFEVEADMFVSLHVNAAGWSNSSANGAGVYYCDSNISKNANGVTGKEIAAALSKDCTDAFGLKKNWGALKGNFVVIREARVPAVLVEIGFLSSSYDRPKITKASLQKKAARAMGKSIVKLLNK